MEKVKDSFRGKILIVTVTWVKFFIQDLNISKTISHDKSTQCLSFQNYAKKISRISKDGKTCIDKNYCFCCKLSIQVQFLA